MKQFFSLSHWAYDCDFKVFETEEEARADTQESIDAARAGQEGLTELCWGEIRGIVGEDGQLIPVPPTPDPETERLRAELTDLRQKMHTLAKELCQKAYFYRDYLDSGEPSIWCIRSAALEYVAQRMGHILGKELATEQVSGEE